MKLELISPYRIKQILEEQEVVESEQCDTVDGPDTGQETE